MNQQLLLHLINEQSNALRLYQSLQPFTPIYQPPNYQQLAYENLLFHAQNLQLLQYKQAQQNDFKPSAKLNILPQSTFSSPQSGLEAYPAATIKATIPVKNTQEPEKPKNSTVGLDIPLRKKLEKMIRQIMTHLSQNDTEAAEKAKEQYKQDPILAMIYEKLVIRYYSSKKCKEDIIRYILRKLFKTLRTNIIKEEKVSNKRASFVICQRYFSSRFDEIKEAGVNLDDEEELLQFFMPYRKGSKNRTMNNSFIAEIFSSEEFCKVYETFLNNQFERFLLADNNRKIKKLIDLLVTCVHKNDITKLSKCNRLPWLDVWLQDARSIAASLLTQNQTSPSNSSKKIKDDSP
jgi:hypothetical protein